MSIPSGEKTFISSSNSSKRSSTGTSKYFSCSLSVTVGWSLIRIVYMAFFASHSVVEGLPYDFFFVPVFCIRILSSFTFFSFFFNVTLLTFLFTILVWSIFLSSWRRGKLELRLRFQDVSGIIMSTIIFGGTKVGDGGLESAFEVCAYSSLQLSFSICTYPWWGRIVFMSRHWLISTRLLCFSCAMYWNKV